MHAALNAARPRPASFSPSQALTTGFSAAAAIGSIARAACSAPSLGVGANSMSTPSLARSSTSNFNAVAKRSASASAQNIDGIGVRRAGRQRGVECSARGVRQPREFHVVVVGCVGRQRARPAAVGHDGEAVSARQSPAGKCFGRCEQVSDLRHADRADTTQRSVEDRVVADQHAGVAHHHARAGRVPPRLEHDHRLDAGRNADARQQRTRILDAFDVQQDRTRRGVAGQVVEDLRERDIGLRRPSPAPTRSRIPRSTRNRAGRRRSRRTVTPVPAHRAAPSSCAQLAFSPMSGRISPRQLGPNTRTRAHEHARRPPRASWRPVGAASHRPGDSTSIAGMPVLPASSIRSGN